jgi:Periplasmic copper-binding protein (NosD)
VRTRSKWTALVLCALFLLVATAAHAGSPRPDTFVRLLPPPLPVSHGQKFYVATSGNDENPGTFDRPWRTIQHAADSLEPGQSALVRGGTYLEDVRVTRNGTADEPITITNYPFERPVVQSPNPPGRLVGALEDSYPFEIDSASYLRVHGFVIQDATGPSTADVYFAQGAHDVELSGNDIRKSADQGVYGERTTHDLQILANKIHDNGPSPIHQSHGIYLEGVDHLIANNVVYANRYGYGIQIYPSADGVLIVHNTLVDNGNTESSSGGIVLGGGEDTTVDNTTIVNNIVAFNASAGIRSFFPAWVMQPKGNAAYSNVGYGDPDGDFSTWEGGGIDYSKGNLVADPLFSDLVGDDFHVEPDSPAVDRAMSAYSPDTDFDGVLRSCGPMPDIGAFESC